MKKLALILFLVVLLVGITKAFAIGEITYEEYADQAYNYLNKIPGSPSVSVLVVSKGEVRLKKSYGSRDIRTGEKASPDTNYRAACLTKPFTSMAALILSERGLLDLDAPVKDVLPEFPEYAKTVTVRQLMNNDSALPYYQSLWPKDGAQLMDQDVLKLITDKGKLRFEPGNRVEWCNDTAFAILSLVIERVSGMSFPDFLEENIFNKTGMKNTVAFVEGTNTVPERAYGTDSNTEGYFIADQYAYSAVLGDGGIYTNLNDLYLWDKALRDHTLISEKTQNEVYTTARSRIVHLYQKESFGAGWYFVNFEGVPVIYNDGGTIGFSHNSYRVPERDTYVVILTNSNERYDVYRHSNNLLRMALSE